MGVDHELRRPLPLGPERGQLRDGQPARVAARVELRGRLLDGDHVRPAVDAQFDDEHPLAEQQLAEHAVAHLLVVVQAGDPGRDVRGVGQGGAVDRPHRVGGGPEGRHRDPDDGLAARLQLHVHPQLAPLSPATL